MFGSSPRYQVCLLPEKNLGDRVAFKDRVNQIRASCGRPYFIGPLVPIVDDDFLPLELIAVVDNGVLAGANKHRYLRALAVAG